MQRKSFTAIDMVGTDSVNIIYAPAEHKSNNYISSKGEILVLSPSTDLVDTWNTDFNAIHTSGERVDHLSFLFCKSKFQYYERYSFSFLGGMEKIVASCKERITSPIMLPTRAL